MIIVNGRFQTTNENIVVIKNAIATMEKASRLEDGCNDFTFSVEINNPSILRITECWDNMEALEAHFASPHMAEFRKSLATLPAEGRDVHFYKVTQEVRHP